jgi:hypothetical protein
MDSLEEGQAKVTVPIVIARPALGHSRCLPVAFLRHPTGVKAQVDQDHRPQVAFCSLTFTFSNWPAFPDDREGTIEIIFDDVTDLGLDWGLAAEEDGLRHWLQYLLATHPRRNVASHILPEEVCTQVLPVGIPTVGYISAEQVVNDQQSRQILGTPAVIFHAHLR